MCPYSKVCNMFMACLVATDILACGLEREKCPYNKNTQPHVIENHYPYEPPPYNNFVIASGSMSFISSNSGQYIGDSPDGRKLYNLNPGNISIAGSTFRIVDNEGKEKYIDFEKLQ